MGLWSVPLLVAAQLVWRICRAGAVVWTTTVVWTALGLGLGLAPMGLAPLVIADAQAAQPTLAIA